MSTFGWASPRSLFTVRVSYTLPLSRKRASKRVRLAVAFQTRAYSCWYDKEQTGGIRDSFHPPESHGLSNMQEETIYIVIQSIQNTHLAPRSFYSGPLANPSKSHKHPNYNLLAGAPFHNLPVRSIASLASASIRLNKTSHVGTS